MRVITPLLRVADGYGVSPLTAVALIQRGSVATVPSDSDAREVLFHLGLQDCCVDDRITVSLGGPVTCDGHPPGLN